MTILNPTSGNNSRLSAIQNVHDKSVTMLGLIQSMDAQVEHIGPKGTGLYTCIELAMPLVRQLSNDLEKIIDDECGQKDTQAQELAQPAGRQNLPTLEDLACDTVNILELIMMAEDDMGRMSWNAPVEKDVIRRHGAVLTVARKLIEELARHLEGTALAPHMQAAERAAVR
ncbi:MAG: hypothetical protein WCK17_13865 [Verrucomicrobiota bacterium]